MKDIENELKNEFDTMLDRAVRPTVPENLEEKLSKLIDDCAANERRLKLRSISLKITAVAASVLLIVGIHFATRQSQPVDTYTDPYEAAAAVEKTLSFMFAELNKGLEQIEIIDDTFERVNTVINNLKYQ